MRPPTRRAASLPAYSSWVQPWRIFAGYLVDTFVEGRRSWSRLSWSAIACGLTSWSSRSRCSLVVRMFHVGYAFASTREHGARQSVIPADRRAEGTGCFTRWAPRSRRRWPRYWPHDRQRFQPYRPLLGFAWHGDRGPPCCTAFHRYTHQPVPDESDARAIDDDVVASDEATSNSVQDCQRDIAHPAVLPIGTRCRSALYTPG